MGPSLSVSTVQAPPPPTGKRGGRTTRNKVFFRRTRTSHTLSLQIRFHDGIVGDRRAFAFAFRSFFIVIFANLGTGVYRASAARLRLSTISSTTPHLPSRHRHLNKIRTGMVDLVEIEASRAPPSGDVGLCELRSLHHFASVRVGGRAVKRDDYTRSSRS